MLYNRRAIVDHVRYDANVEWWNTKMARLAKAEWSFTQIHPELPPHFDYMFSKAARLPPARGRLVQFAHRVPRKLPVLGELVWKSADVYFPQQLAPHFLEAWEELEREGGGQSDRSELPAGTAGSEPSGPK